MTTLPLVVQALAPQRVGKVMNGQTCVSDWMLVASPLTVPEGFHARSLSEAAVGRMRAAVLADVRRLGPPEHGGISARPFATGVAVEGQNLATGDGADLVLDAGGVVVGRMRRRLTQEEAWHVGETADQVIKPLLDMALSVLGHCEVVGKTEVHLHVRITPTARGARPVLALYTAHTSGELKAPPGSEAFFGGHVHLPVEDNTAKELAERMMRELARASGIDWWER